MRVGNTSDELSLGWIRIEKKAWRLLKDWKKLSQGGITKILEKDQAG